MITYKLMRDYFANYGLMLKLSSVSVKAFIEKLVEHGKLNKITLIRNNISYSSSDNLFIQTGKEEKAYINPTLKKKGLDRFLKIFDNADSRRIYEIPEELNCDDISITFNLNGKYRTVRLRNLENISIVEDIPDSIFNETDYEEKLINYMIETADNYRQKIIMHTQNEV